MTDQLTDEQIAAAQREIAREVILQVINERTSGPSSAPGAREWLAESGFSDEKHINTNGKEMVWTHDVLEAYAASREAATSMTYGDLVGRAPQVAAQIEPHEWDNRNPSEQRDWLLTQLADEYSADAQIQEMAAAKDAEIEKLTQERDAARKTDCCSDAHWELSATLEHVAALGFEKGRTEHDGIIEEIWHNRRAEAAEATVERLRESLGKIHDLTILENSTPATRKIRALAEAALAAAPEESRDE